MAKIAKKTRKVAAKKTVKTTERAKRTNTVRALVRPLLTLNKAVPLATIIKRGYAGRTLPEYPEAAITRVFAGIHGDEPGVKVTVKDGEATLVRA